MKKILNHTGTLLLSLFALFPLFISYRIADTMYLLVFYVFGYRKKVVLTNLKNAFPEKTPAEIETILKRFYRHLSDLMVESIKLRTISIKSLKNRMEVVNPELLNQYFDQGRSVLVLTMHYNNWEWQSILQQYLKHKCLLVYNPARNEIHDRYINKMRSRFGAELISTKQILKTVLRAQQNNEHTLTWLCADQRPQAESRFWTTFLNQEAGFFLGPETLPRRSNQVIFYQHIEKIGRGKYKSHFELLSEEPKLLPPNGILKMYVEKIESIIKDKPEFYLWSHKRWKHERPSNIEIQ